MNRGPNDKAEPSYERAGERHMEPHARRPHGQNTHVLFRNNRESVSTVRGKKGERAQRSEVGSGSLCRASKAMVGILS